MRANKNRLYIPLQALLVKGCNTTKATTLAG